MPNWLTILVAILVVLAIFWFLGIQFRADAAAAMVAWRTS